MNKNPFKEGDILELNTDLKKPFKNRMFSYFLVLSAETYQTNDEPYDETDLRLYSLRTDMYYEIEYSGDFHLIALSISSKT